MHDDRPLVEGRLDRALRQFIRPAQYTARVPLTLSAWRTPGEPVPVAEALTGTYEPFATGTDWGSPWSTWWFRLEGAVPEGWAGRRVEAVIDPGFTDDAPGFQAEGLVYDAEGVPIKGIHPRNRHIPVAAPAAGGESVRLLLEAAANPSVLRDGFVPTRLGDVLTAGDEPLYRFASAELAVLDETVWHLVLDIEVLSELMHELPEDRPRRHEILRALENALDALDLHDVPGTAAAARAELTDALGRPAHSSAHRVSAAGHAHIDSAWLWPLRETVRKASRTFANVTALAGEYPELVFACSQAQQYAWVKEHQPHIWERIKKAVADGNWAPVGSMWVESDANMPGGEALARQIVHGKRFFLEELGVDTEEIWLPDSFGYTAAFPQLAKLAGVKWFLTQKLSWNQSNKMPHHTFWWEGIDGTRVFTHFPPVDTYNAQFSASELAHAEKNFADKGLATRSLVPFGYGDGGGGPTREMLEKARRLASLEGSPTVEIQPPSVFFTEAEREYGPRRRCGRASCIWSCTGPRTPPRPRPSRATGAASICCARPSCGPRPPPCTRPATPIRTTSWTGSGRRCCCTSSTTSCPAHPSPGCTARRGTPTRWCSPSWRRSSRGRWPRWAAAGPPCSTPRRTSARRSPSWTRGRPPPCRPGPRSSRWARAVRRSRCGSPGWARHPWGPPRRHQRPPAAHPMGRRR
ncbi:hypothetical protein SVIO_080450 [Streptomyces violaceusniger]|uniref:Uncharacterized protein n=1 Tax=Streptomyces violaceusniger TaxID=68280 RepID=A0A4D4L899_STRVO|nr:hypothetical protein SVIO_080450 [Streptomyces violaceusniger]